MSSPGWANCSLKVLRAASIFNRGREPGRVTSTRKTTRTIARKKPQSQWHLINEGAQFWILGIKTEGPEPVIVTRGGATELLGGLMYSSSGTRTQEQPAFVIEDSCASFTISEADCSKNAYPVLVRQVRGGSMIPVWSTP